MSASRLLMRRGWHLPSAAVFLSLTLALDASDVAWAGGQGFWDADPQVTAEWDHAPIYLGVGKSATLSISPVDRDSWWYGGHVDHTELDTTTTHWKITYPPPSGIEVTHIGNTWTWTAPTDIVGEFVVDVWADDNRSIIDLRNDDGWGATKAIIVCRVSGLLCDGVPEHDKANHCINLKAATGNVVVTALLEPSWVEEYDLPAGFVTWTGGNAPTPPNQLTRWVPLTTVVDTEVKAKVGTVDEKAVTVHVVDGGTAFTDSPPLLTQSSGSWPVPQDAFGIITEKPGEAGDPFVSFRAYLPQASASWRYSVESVVHWYKLGISQNCPQHNLLDPVGDTWLGYHFLQAESDLTPILTRDVRGTWSWIPPRSITWCSDFTLQHELFHKQDFDDRYWYYHMGLFPADVSQFAVYFDCVNGPRNAAEAHAAENSLMQTAAWVRTNGACVDWDADVNVEYRAYDSDRPSYLGRAAAIRDNWP